MRVLTCNVNGIRSAARHGFFDFLPGLEPDVVCLQEIRAHESQLDEQFYPKGFHCNYVEAERKGYSGVAIYTRNPPSRVVRAMGVDEFDCEGRYLEVVVDGVGFVSVYMPSGSSGDHRQAAKYRFLDAFLPLLQRLKRRRREYVICGDWNIAHRRIDIKNWRANQKHSGFLPEERAWMDKVLGPRRYVDAFRAVNSEPHQYTWWSNRGQAWAKNVGWRIDYQIVTPKLGRTVRSASIYKEQRFSDHAPLTIDYEL